MSLATITSSVILRGSFTDMWDKPKSDMYSAFAGGGRELARETTTLVDQPGTCIREQQPHRPSVRLHGRPKVGILGLAQPLLQTQQQAAPASSCRQPLQVNMSSRLVCQPDCLVEHFPLGSFRSAPFGCSFWSFKDDTPSCIWNFDG
jgi:hypothetical protein